MVVGWNKLSLACSEKVSVARKKIGVQIWSNDFVREFCVDSDVGLFLGFSKLVIRPCNENASAQNPISFFECFTGLVVCFRRRH